MRVFPACALVFPACALFILTCALVFPACALAFPACAVFILTCALIFPACGLIFPACTLAFPACALFILTCALVFSVCVLVFHVRAALVACHTHLRASLASYLTGLASLHIRLASPSYWYACLCCQLCLPSYVTILPAHGPIVCMPSSLTGAQLAMPLQLQFKHTKFVHDQMGLFQVQVALIRHRHPSFHHAPYLCRIVALLIPSQPPSSSLLLLILYHCCPPPISPLTLSCIEI